MNDPDQDELVSAYRDYTDQVDSTLRQTLPRMLRAIRKHLGMDVAFIAEFTDGRRVFRRVDIGPDVEDGMPLPQVGAGHPLEETYCQRIVDGRLSELTPDTSVVLEVRDLAATHALQIGAYLGVPLHLRDRRLYGTLCCYNFKPDYSLGERDVGVMQVLGEAISDLIEKELLVQKRQLDIRSGVASVLQGEGLSTVYQPIVDLKTVRPVGFEALSRFSVVPGFNTEDWFENAASIGHEVLLEIRAIELALEHFSELPTDSYLAINVSAETLISEQLSRVLKDVPFDRLVLEITERAPINRYEGLLEALVWYRGKGARLAVDDAGAGYASFRHVLVLQPDLIKLDKSLVHDIDVDQSRRELAMALIQFSRKTGSKLIAEGVETAAELATLREMGVGLAQGYYLGSPSPAGDMAA